MAIRNNNINSRKIYVGTNTEVVPNDGDALISGKVGIGTTDPSEKLEVNGNVILDASNARLKLKGGVTGTNSGIDWTFNTDSTQYARIDLEYDARDTNGLLIDSGYPITVDFSSSHFRISNNGSEKMRVNTAGNVGIGTTSPDSRLHVAKNGNANGGSILMGEKGNGTSKWSYLAGTHYNQDTGSTNGTGSAGVAIIGSLATETYNKVLIGGNPWELNAATQIEFWTHSSTLSTQGGTQRGYINSGGDWFLANTLWVDNADGNVGIGTTSPSAKLHIATQGEGELAGGNSSSAGGSHLILKDEGSTSRTLMSGPSIVFQTPANADGTNVWATSRILGSPAAAGSARGTISLQVRDQYDPLSDGTSWNWRTALTAINNGNVGIGTNDPQGKLEVQGSAPYIFITDDTETESGIIFRDLQAGMSQAAAIKFSSSDNKLRFYNNDTTAQRMVIDVSGNVGIGTTSPGSKLEVTGDTASALLTLKSENGGSNDAFMRFYNEGAGSSYSVGLDSSDAKFKIAYDTDGDSLTTGTKLVMDTSGNVGIGTTSPSNKLSLAGSGQNWNTSPAIKMWDSFNSKGWYVGSANNHTPGDFYIRSVTAENLYPVSADKQFTIKQSGNVGIGTTSPSQKLEVSGNAYFTGQAQASNSIMKTHSGHAIFGSNSTTVPVALGRDAANLDLVVSTSGNVGIGTTSPQAGKRLDVRSDANIAGSNAVAGYGYNDTGAGILAQGYATSGTGTNHGIIALSTGSRTGGTNVGGHFSATGAANNYALTTGTGNVGIGKTDPSNKLEIVGPNAVRIHDGTDQGSIFFRGDRDDVYIRESNYQLLFGAPSGMVFELDTNSNNGDFFNVTHRGSSRFRINGETGHVGIGTTSPDTLLQTTNTADGTDYISYEIGNTAVNASNKGGFAIYELGTKQVTLEYYRDGSAITNLSTPYIFTIDTNSQERMRITNAGNVGIGTTSPGEKLEVLGNVKATNFILSSDASLKEDVNKLNVKVEAKWKSYKFKDEDEVRYGVIAQELEETNPELVKTDDKGLKSVKYIDLLIAKIAELEARLEKAGL